MAQTRLDNAQVEKLLLAEVPGINKRFWRNLKAINLIELITRSILKGISPVLGAIPRFKPYSQNYIDVIQGKARFIGSKGGGSIRIEAPTHTLISFKKHKDLLGSSTSVRRGKVTGYFQKGLGVGKKVSPVNLKVSGKMLDSLTFNENTGGLIAKDEKWSYHNDGTSKIPERRLLPNRPGEQFNRAIQNRITDALTDAIGLKKSKVKRFLTLKINIR